MSDSRSWIDEVDDLIDGDYVRFEDGDEKVLKIVQNPRAGPITFTQADGTKKVNNGLELEVLIGDNPQIKKWTITSKSLMQQIKSICVREGIGANLAGAILRITASGTGMQRKYFVKLLQKPQGDSGAAWAEGQRAGAK